jgi:hypothetical protein
MSATPQVFHDTSGQRYGNRRLGRTLPTLLEQLGMPGHADSASNRGHLRPPTHRRHDSIWMRHEHDLEEFGQQIKRQFRRQLKQVRHDDTANHEAATFLIAVYERIKKLFSYHGGFATV